MKRLCVLAIVVFLILHSAALGDDPVSANREAITKRLIKLAARAQEFYRRPYWEDGGQGSFANLTLSDLTQWPANVDGVFVEISNSTSQVVLLGTGIEIGYDGSTPTQVVIFVFSDSVSVVVSN